MTRTASRFVSRAVLLQVLFSALAGAIVVAVAPYFLLLTGKGAMLGAIALGAGVLAGGVLAALLSLIWLYRHRYLLRALALGSHAVDTMTMPSKARVTAVVKSMPAGRSGTVKTDELAESASHSTISRRGSSLNS